MMAVTDKELNLAMALDHALRALHSIAITTTDAGIAKYAMTRFNEIKEEAGREPVIAR